MRMGLVAAVLAALCSFSYAESVGVFYNSSFNDTGAASGREAGEVARSVTALGHTANLFAGTSAGAWASAASFNDVLLMPEPERTTPSERIGLANNVGGVLRAWVSGGGRLIVHGDYTGNDQDTARFLNQVFGYSLTENRETETSFKTPAAAGTVFATGQNALPSNNGTTALRNLPGSARAAYRRGVDNTVVQFNYGSGEIIFLGWDWFNARPLPGTQNSGWLPTLDLAIRGAGGTAPVPEPGTLALVGLAAAGLIVHRRRRRLS
ncbi:MAG: PEP-CTERM sorting domain-containing protein [Planctomycetota bacterium]|nr:PEP-CTERM sorting domain-containing protein [Planctomycetota bacterium]